MQALTEIHVQFLVAPYEADAQMAYLALSNLADVVITEDSDLLAYGCPEVLFKLDKTGECDHVRLADLPQNRTLSFRGFTHDNFIEVRHAAPPLSPLPPLSPQPVVAAGCRPACVLQ